MLVIIWTLLGLFILLSGLLLVPLSFSAQAGLDETASFEAVLALAGGLVTIQTAATGGQPLEMRLRLGRWTRRLKPESAVKRFVRFWTDKAAPYLDKQVMKEVLRYLFRLERSLGLKFCFEGEIGLGDPDLTGHLAEFLKALNAGQWECRLQPNFTDTALRFQGTVQGKALPISLFWLTGRLLLSPPVRSVWWLRSRNPKNKIKTGGAI
jgi:hypothetical protein